MTSALRCHASGRGWLELLPVEHDECAEVRALLRANHHELLTIRRHIPIPSDAPGTRERVGAERIPVYHVQRRASDFGGQYARLCAVEHRGARMRPDWLDAAVDRDRDARTARDRLDVDLVRSRLI